MKAITKLSALVLLMMIGTAATAQLAVGPKAGFVANGYYGDDANDVRARKGFNAGLFLKYGSGLFAIQPELLFVQKGAERSTTILGTSISEEWKVNYLDIPVLVKLQIPIDETLYPHALVGPYASFKLSESYEAGAEGGGSITIDDKEAEFIDYGVVFGLGLDIHGEAMIFQIDTRYGLGLNQIEDNDEPEDYKNGTYSLNVGVGFLIGQ